MEHVSQKLATLKSARYLQASLESLQINNLELLSLGQKLRTQIEKHWQLAPTTSTTPPKLITVTETASNIKEVDNRLQFVYTKFFRDNLKALQHSNNDFLNAETLKIKLLKQNLTFNEDNPVKLKTDANRGSTQLITEHIFHESCGLAKLYKIQRERKIWWMRYSSDPSRYYLEPYKFLHDTETIPNNAQSITIKSRLCFGDLSVEDITLVPLNNLKLEDNVEFKAFSELTANKKQLPTVIRSVIDLDVATCALIFDGAANNRRVDTLFLNRKLAPYQCQVLLEHNANSSELKNLSKHISNVMLRAGLRIFCCDDHENKLKDNFDIEHADRIGIPYTIFVNDDSLTTGLLKLRSRDTTLKETIHISDIPNYLLSIFCAS